MANTRTYYYTADVYDRDDNCVPHQGEVTVGPGEEPSGARLAVKAKFSAQGGSARNIQVQRKP